MPLAGTAAITELWAKCKAWFGRSLEASTTATTASIQLKSNAGDNLGDSATIGAATSTKAGVMTADMYNKLDGVEAGANAYTHPGFTATAAAAKKVGNDAQGHVVLGAALTASDVGAAASSHAHGNITSGGDITATAPTVASGDKLVINDESASKITNGPSFGTSQTTYLRNDGTWATPAGTTYSDFTGANFDAAGANGLVPAPAKGSPIRYLAAGGAWGELNLRTVKSETTGELSLELDGNVDGYQTYNFCFLELPKATVSVDGVMSATDKTKLDGIATGATANAATTTTPKMDGTAAVGSETSYAKGDHVHPTDTSRAPTSHASSATTYGKGTNANYGHVKLSDSTSATTAAASGGTAATPKAVSDALASAKTYADGVADDALNDAKDYADGLLSSLSGAALFCGTLGTSGADYTQAQLEATSYEAGWYWVVSVAGTYVGQSCEVGDMVFAVKDKVSSYKASDFSVVQNNVVEMTAAEVDAICV